MDSKYVQVGPELYRYILDHGTRPDPVLAGVESDSEATGVAQMQMSPDQGAFVTVLVKAMGASAALEVGTFTGYGAISIARGLVGGGKLIACELSEEYAAIARANIEKAGLSDLVEIRLGPAVETLRAMPTNPVYDFAFIDADKMGYADYYEEVLTRLRPGGMVMLDNTLQDGNVLAPDGPSSEAIVALNDVIAHDERVDVAMLGVADGITLALKR